MIRLLFALFTVAAFPAVAAELPSPRVTALTVTGVIDPVIAEYVSAGIAEASEKKSSAVLIRLDTPGGLLDSTRLAVSAIINSDIPVIVYVGPRGARATSAGAFLVMAADVAAMAPETHIGAAHPVTIGGNEKRPDSDPASGQETGGDGKPADGKKAPAGKDVMEEKMVSDAAAYIRALAAERGRNADWAEKAVRESVSLTAKEAVAQNVIEIVAADEAALLKAVSGRSIKKGGRTLELRLDGATVVEYAMSRIQALLHMLAHPNVAYILMTVGIYGLIYELAAPGIGLGGAVGVICLLLAFFSLQVLPLNALGLGLIALGVIMMVLEMLAPSHGLLTAAGLVAFAAGSFLMIDTHGGMPFPRVSIALIASTVGTTALFFGVAIRKIWGARRAPPSTGVESMAGMTGVVERELAPDGTVMLGGELWTARSVAGPVGKGSSVKVVRVEGNTLVVEPTA